MVSLEQRQALAAFSTSDPYLKKFQLFLAGETVTEANVCEGGVREELLSAIILKDSERFQNKAAEIGRRKIYAGSDWCQDDYLVFLLVLGNELFGHRLTFLKNVIEARGNNPNPIPRKINEVFAALERQEFGIEGEFCFLKIPFLRLVSKLRLGPSDAGRAIRAMSEPKLFDQLTPFLQLLMQNAHDIILTERQPLATETTTQLIEGFEAHAKDLSLRQWWHVVAALPGRMIWALIAFVVAAGLIPVLIGIGKGIVESRSSVEVRTRPAAITVVGIRAPGSDLPNEALLLAQTLAASGRIQNKRPLLITIEGSPWQTATPSFIVEVSHPHKPISAAFAFTQDSAEGLRPFTIVPVQRDAGRFRAILSEQPKGQRLFFVLQFEGDANEDVQSVGRRVVLRPLQ
jgi:hypothetical protein